MHPLPSFARRPWLALVLAAFFGPVSGSAEITLSPPDEGLIVDAAGLLNPDQTRQIRDLSDKLLTETAIPLVVVTMERKDDYGGGSSGGGGASGRW